MTRTASSTSPASPTTSTRSPSSERTPARNERVVVDQDDRGRPHRSLLAPAAQVHLGALARRASRSPPCRRARAMRADDGVGDAAAGPAAPRRGRSPRPCRARTPRAARRRPRRRRRRASAPACCAALTTASRAAATSASSRSSTGASPTTTSSTARRGAPRPRARAPRARCGRSAPAAALALVQPRAQLALLAAGQRAPRRRVVGVALDQGERLQHRVVQVGRHRGALVGADAAAALLGQLAADPPGPRRDHEADAGHGDEDGERHRPQLAGVDAGGEQRRDPAADQHQAAEHARRGPGDRS